jgi:hypothetical protein
MKIDVNNPFEVADHDTIMRKPGYMLGYYGRVEPKKLVMEIKEKLGDYLKKAEGMFVTYYVNENASMSMFFGKGQGINVMDEIEALCNKNTDTIFDIQYDNSLSLDVFEYEVLLSGIGKIGGRNGRVRL